MPDLAFLVESAAAKDGAVCLGLRIGNLPARERVRGVDLLCDVRIEAARRGYTTAEEAGLADLFGPRARWRDTVRPIAWAQARLDVPGFSDHASCELALPCAPGPHHAAAKYLRALEGGEVPLSLLFRGAVLYEARGGAVQMAPIPWTKEAAFRLPVPIVRDALAGAVAR
jgi:hypothetical protein